MLWLAMPSGTQAAGAPTTWLRRLFEAPGYSVWLVGLAVALFGILVFGLQELLLGRYRLASDDPAVLADMRVALTHVVITAYLLTAYVHAQRTTEQSIGALLPLLRARGADELLGHARRERVAFGLSVLIGILVYVVVTTRFSPGPVYLAPTTWDPEDAWHRVLGLVMAVLSIRLVTLIVLESGRLSALAGAIERIDLLSPEAISPFARQGLTYALLVIGVVSVFALFLVDLRFLRLVGIVLIGTLVVAAVALLLPLRGIRGRIIAAKREELRWCRQQMRERRARLSDGAGADAASLDELVAWEARIQGVREWPVDVSTFKRFGLYLLLPLASWAGGALVERGIDALLD
jgi:hypothetical protein